MKENGFVVHKAGACSTYPRDWQVISLSLSLLSCK